MANASGDNRQALAENSPLAGLRLARNAAIGAKCCDWREMLRLALFDGQFGGK
jgi:hypothetical protein